MPAPTFTRYFAEGVGGSFFNTIFSLSNFGSAAATATMTFHTDAGQVVTHTVPVPGGRPVTIDVDTAARPERRGLRHDDHRRPAHGREPHDALGCHGLRHARGQRRARGADRWFLAEGVTGAFDTYVLVYNPSDTAAQLTMSFNRIAPNPPVVRTYTLEPHRRLTVAVDGVDPVLAATDVAIDVTSTNGVGIVVERSSVPVESDHGLRGRRRIVGGRGRHAVVISGRASRAPPSTRSCSSTTPTPSPPRSRCATCGASARR